ncbi:uncharacterized protein [Zea mays]|uniref:uncharacterized protein isoform X2 n=1 Tax=Zea mays TaxID=4577 RepID=UPI0004DE9804|nr:uncharacterized protein LOC103629045 isoform X2 [Zea mays]|eukprot:XP_008648470.1 uncharacterized protein LOC103629045 isoform X2 [Zea mays]
MDSPRGAALSLSLTEENVQLLFGRGVSPTNEMTAPRCEEEDWSLACIGQDDRVTFGTSGNCNPSEYVDWDSIEVEDRWTEEGRQNVTSEQALYIQLGLHNEDVFESAQREEESARHVRWSNRDFLDGEASAAIPCSDSVVDEERIVYDMNNPVKKKTFLNFPSGNFPSHHRAKLRKKPS